jgi:hypothetical protein
MKFMQYVDESRNVERLEGKKNTDVYVKLLRHCATSRKVASSISDGVIGIFHWLNPSGRTMALGSTQAPTEMSTRDISWG